MTDMEIQKKALYTMVIMNAAITNLCLYPPSSAMIANPVDRLYQTLQEVLDKEESLVFAESEKNLLICGDLLSRKDQEKPQVMAFIKILLDFEIKSVTFERGLGKADLMTFLQMLSKKPEDVEKEGGLQKVWEADGLPHILLDQKVYIAKDKDHALLASLDIKDEEIIKYITGAGAISDIDSQKVKEMAKNPEWISRIFQSGMKNITRQEGTISNIELSERVVHMIRSLNNIADNVNKDGIFRQVATSIADMDIEVISMLLTQNMEGLLSDEIFDHIVNQIDDEKFEDLATKIKHLKDMAIATDTAHNTSEIELINKADKNLMSSDKGKRLVGEIEEKRAREKEEMEREFEHLKDKANRIIEGDEKIFLDEKVMQSLDGVIEQLFSKDQNETVEAIIDRLGDELLSENPGVRGQVSEALSNIIESQSDEKRTDMVGRLSDKLCSWIRLETLITPAYEQICVQLQNLVHTLIRSHQFAESGPILEVFNLIDSGELKKDEAIQSISSSVLREIVTEELLNILLKEFLSNEQNKQKEAGFNLANIGATPVNRLLDILRESKSSSERVLILQIVSEIGHASLPALIDEIEEGGDWYYIRNLSLLLGRIGSEADVEVLRPLLTHENYLVQQEALKSINRIGGEHKGGILLSALPVSDDRLKIDIVNMLGSLKYRDAVSPLLGLLKSKSFISSKSRTELEEKICVALGRIGAPEAIKTLESIAKQKSLFSIKSYHERVEIAAGRALVMIKKRGKETEKI